MKTSIMYLALLVSNSSFAHTSSSQDLVNIEACAYSHRYVELNSTKVALPKYTCLQEKKSALSNQNITSTELREAISNGIKRANRGHIPEPFDPSKAKEIEDEFLDLYQSVKRKILG
ncbi:MAG: hypothetical protein HON90_09365 [Halobacteriovoraceae bacterium]|jgi:hypothetical protein|nr:hypothetical protein [Halobacteriovoraceae bacterium]